ncbi:hypothetical protein [Streptomyces sp. FH025]|uniref:hypothetical protein n=1 Tax=Streptomyces sp. FH025 TaxID=2815937 RepID=UPI001A9ED6A0|nr:hypothetical protein [Streptomyces sp. FH025]MBO1419882.1 hypothetical protein [Streptomyces sp. FH025]
MDVHAVGELFVGEDGGPPAHPPVTRGGVTGIASLSVKGAEPMAASRQPQD